MTNSTKLDLVKQYLEKNGLRAYEYSNFDGHLLDKYSTETLQDLRKPRDEKREEKLKLQTSE